MANAPSSVQFPIKDPVVNAKGIIAISWQKFFQFIKSSLDPLGVEKISQLLNNQAAAADITGLKLDSANTSQAVIEYLIQRITTGSGAQELITSGTIHAVFKPISNSWALVAMGTPGPSTSGITFSITSDGQVQYTSTNITGTEFMSRIAYRVRILAAKSQQYSGIGPGPIR